MRRQSRSPVSINHHHRQANHPMSILVSGSHQDMQVDEEEQDGRRTKDGDSSKDGVFLQLKVE